MFPIFFPFNGEGASAICTRKSVNSFFSILVRARVYTRSFMFFAVTSVTELRNKVRTLFDDVPLFPKKQGTFWRKQGTFLGKQGTFLGKQGTFSRKCGFIQMK